MAGNLSKKKKRIGDRHGLMATIFACHCKGTRFKSQAGRNYLVQKFFIGWDTQVDVFHDSDFAETQPDGQ